uniref:AlNc14C63G4543 protein n=1 Tax=Albugo laibachii Nc14 TaxID=890382 RepID=F0WD20_9STRA|nr:AlNc14C63G4543 [Albugo laibachii Nc14]|eukprot:CCA19092.1 AlNc14C63G4543 [Albugo laibachii Nc14]
MLSVTRDLTSDITPSSNANAAYDCNGLRVVTLLKTLLLIDIPGDQQQNRGTLTPASKITICKRESLEDSLGNAPYLRLMDQKVVEMLTNSRSRKAYAESRTRI